MGLLKGSIFGLVNFGMIYILKGLRFFYHGASYSTAFAVLHATQINHVLQKLTLIMSEKETKLN